MSQQVQEDRASGGLTGDPKANVVRTCSVGNDLINFDMLSQKKRAAPEALLSTPAANAEPIHAKSRVAAWPLCPCTMAGRNPRLPCSAIALVVAVLFVTERGLPAPGVVMASTACNDRDGGSDCNCCAFSKDGARCDAGHMRTLTGGCCGWVIVGSVTFRCDAARNSCPACPACVEGFPCGSGTTPPPAMHGHGDVV